MTFNLDHSHKAPLDISSESGQKERSHGSKSVQGSSSGVTEE